MAQRDLGCAAVLYEKISREVLTGDKCLLDIAPYPWALKDGQTWTSDMRKDEIRRLETALSLERQAIAEIELALAASGETKTSQSKPR